MMTYLFEARLTKLVTCTGCGGSGKRWLEMAPPDEPLADWRTCGCGGSGKMRIPDGVIRQTQEDVSVEDPAKSAWWDVEQRIDDVELLVLMKDLGDHKPIVAAVRMSDGLFELNQNQFLLSPCAVEDPKLRDGKFRPHYYRVRTKYMSVNEWQEQLGITDAPDLFSIGWQYIVDGEVRATQILQIY